MSDVQRSVAPWLFVRDSRRAVQFHKHTFSAVETYRHEGHGGVVERLSIGASEVWVSDASLEHGNLSPETLKGTTFRISGSRSGTSFAKACAAGAEIVHRLWKDMAGELVA